MAVQKRREGINPMFWVLSFSIAVYMVANTPLFYSLIAVHKWQGIKALWGYAPQQFLFMTVFFPFAALFTFTSIYLMVSRLMPVLPNDFPLLWFFRNWPVSFLLGAIVASVLGIIVYFSSAWSLDKLQPKYAHMAIKAIKSVENEVNSTPKKDQEEYRDKLIRDSKHAFESLELPPEHDSPAIDNWLSKLSPQVLLRVFQDPNLQIRLRLVNPAILGLNVMQFFFSLLVAFGAVVVSLICFYSARELSYDGKNMPELSKVIQATFYAVYLFGFYPLCYGQYRMQITSLVGTGTTILQDILAALGVILVLICLKTLQGHNQAFSLETVFRFIPIALVGSGSIISAIQPELLRQLIGSEAKPGTQLVLMMFVAAVSSVAFCSLYSRSR